MRYAGAVAEPWPEEVDDPEKARLVERRLKEKLAGWQSGRWPSRRQWEQELHAGGIYKLAAQVMPHSLWAERLGYVPIRRGERPTPRVQWTEEKIRLALLAMFDERAQLGLRPWPGFYEWLNMHDIRLYWACAHDRPKGISWWRKHTIAAQKEAERRATGALG